MNRPRLPLACLLAALLPVRASSEPLTDGGRRPAERGGVRRPPADAPAALEGGLCSDPELADRFRCREVIVEHGPEFDLEHILASYDLRLLGTIPQLRQASFVTPIGTDLATLISRLELEPGVGPGHAERNRQFAPPECNQLNAVILELGPEAVGLLFRQPALATMHVPEVNPAPGVLVAVLDTGVSRSHPFLATSLAASGIDPVGGTLLADDTADGFDADGSGIADDGYGHGTAVAGLVHLVSPRSTILPVRVLDDECQGSAFALAAGIVGAVDAGARILNLSLGAIEESGVVAAALRYAAERAVLVVASGGNRSRPQRLYGVLFPANQPEVLAVAAVDELLVAPDWVVADPAITLSAPGVGLVAPWRSGYAELDGTSFATALTSGAAAVALGQSPGLDPPSLVAHLSRTAIPVDGWNTVWLQGKLGAGVPDVTAILDFGPARMLPRTTRAVRVVRPPHDRAGLQAGGQAGIAP